MASKCKVIPPIGNRIKKHQNLYKFLNECGYELVFREHSSSQVSKKKGNVDNDIIFSVMKKIAEKELIGRVILISGDGDYKRMIDYLIKKEKLLKIIFPNEERASSLYKKINFQLVVSLSRPNLRKKLCLIKKEEGSLRH